MLPQNTGFEKWRPWKISLVFDVSTNAGVNVNRHPLPPHPGTRWGFVANLIANINKFPYPWGSCPATKVLKCSHHEELEILDKEPERVHESAVLSQYIKNHSYELSR